MSVHNCPLCTGSKCKFYSKDQRREFFICLNCGLVFTPREFYLTPVEEKAEYDLHQNDPNDPRYRRFLARLYEPLRAKLPTGAHGLDFGCGPGPTLSVMFEEAGFRMSLYDPIYVPDGTVLNRSYDFITATEVVEHLHHPGQELARLWKMLNPEGYLGLMTKLVRSPEAFAGWHYKNDLTHVCFFSQASFNWLAEQLSADIEYHGAYVAILRKRPG